jgi:hypothetical protein
MVTVVLNFRRLATFKLKEMAEEAEFDDRSDCTGTLAFRIKEYLRHLSAISCAHIAQPEKSPHQEHLTHSSWIPQSLCGRSAAPGEFHLRQILRE